MCFSYDAVPPELPLSLRGVLAQGAGGGTGLASAERIVLTSQDGTQFSAYVARPHSPNGAGIVILPDVRGLFSFYEQLAERFAVAGVEAIAIDYFGRTAGLAPRGPDFDFMAHVAQTRIDQIAADVRAAIEHLRALPGATPRAIFTVGFCFGGWSSFLQAALQPDLSGVIGFYGSPTASRLGGQPVVERVREISCPVLGLFGGADQSIPAEDVQKFDEALSAAGIEHELITYPGAPHSFFDRRYEEYQQESGDAWQRMLTFIGSHTPRVVA
jgi:carboxymethylenebutenolidase